jgi:NAD(P)-dependent dehydrogenase (short-subunit alcohol dehydrogenase family)
MRDNKTWFITGASRGFGRLWTEAALNRGDQVVATARNESTLGDLVEKYGNAILPLRLDVTDRTAVFAAVQRGYAHFGKLDVIVSNAGYGVLGAVEEVTLEDARANFETNVFGTLNLIQASLPLLREQGFGHILPISSLAGLVSFPLGGIYSSTKFAVVGLGESLAQEVKQFGIKVTLVDPGPFATEFMSQDSMTFAVPLAPYATTRNELQSGFDPSTFPDPKTTITPLLKVIDMSEPPLHLLLGPVLPLAEQVFTERLATLTLGNALYTNQ